MTDQVETRRCGCCHEQYDPRDTFLSWCRKCCESFPIGIREDERWLLNAEEDKLYVEMQVRQQLAKQAQAQIQEEFEAKVKKAAVEREKHYYKRTPENEASKEEKKETPKEEEETEEEHSIEDRAACYKRMQREIETRILNKGVFDYVAYLRIRDKVKDLIDAQCAWVGEQNQRIWESLHSWQEPGGPHAKPVAPDDFDDNEDWRPLFLRPSWHRSDEDRAEEQGRYLLETWAPFWQKYAKSHLLQEELPDEADPIWSRATEEPKPDRKITNAMLGAFHNARRRSVIPRYR
jgi:hypothetical protein